MMMADRIPDPLDAALAAAQAQALKEAEASSTTKSG
jgi:hypothetical protein